MTLRRIPRAARARVLARAAAVLAFALVGAPSVAQEPYPAPARTITVVVPFAPGSGTDVITRLVTAQMARGLKTSIVIENKPGASGQIGSEAVARAQPDGYTLLVATNSTHSGNPFLFKSLRYDPARDFTPIGRMTINPLALLVKADSRLKSVRDLVAHARANPGAVSYGYGNTGGQVSGAMLASTGRFKALAVPYKSTPQAFADIVGGQLDFTLVDFAASKPLIDSGKLRAIAMSGRKRMALAPDVPAVNETPGFEDFYLFAWLGMMAPAGTPAPVVARLNAELRAALEQPELRQRLEQQTGSVVEPTTPEEFVAFLAEQSAFWKRRIAEAEIVPE